MAIKLFVAGLPYAVSNDELEAMFAEYGTVASAQVVTDPRHRPQQGLWLCRV